MIRTTRTRPARPHGILHRSAAALLALLLGAAAVLTGVGGATAAVAPLLVDGDSVYVGDQVHVSGSAIIFPVWKTEPADLDNPGAPDYWGFCLQQTVSADDNRLGTVGDIDSFLGDNYFATDPTIPGKVLWVLAHSYPALTIADLATASGIPTLTADDAISATTTAIWRYTDVTWDATYNWISQDAEDLYWYLVGGANASTGMSPADFTTTVAVAPPGGPQTAGTLIGPFTVSTNQATVSLTSSPALAFTDVAGTAIDASAVVDGQEVYLDARAETAAGTATVTASAVGSSATGKVVSIPTTPGETPTAADHAQSIILVAPADATTEAAATAAFAAAPVPTIGTRATTDNAVDDKVLPLAGGTITDEVGYENLTPNACTPGGCSTQYRVEGELMLVDGGTVTPTGIIADSGYFTVTTSAPGTIDVVFTVSAADAVLSAGRTLVVYEYLREWDTTVPVPTSTLVAQHTDPTDADQTVTVASLPVIGTTLVDDADGDQVLPWNGGTAVDTVAYENLTPGVTYTVEGELFRTADGTTTGITASTVFTPTTADGTVEVVFTVPTGFAGHSLVAFEWLRQAGVIDPVAEHTDLTDAAQTVAVQAVPLAAAAPVVTTAAALAATGGGPVMGLLGAGVVLAVGGILLAARRRETR